MVSSVGLSPRYLGLVAVAIIGIVFHVRSFLLSRRKRRLFDEREPLQPREILRQHYGRDLIEIDAAVSIWHECAQRLRVPADRLRLSDRFDFELAPADFIAGLRDPRDDLARFVSSYAKEHNVLVDLQKPSTLDELIKPLLLQRLQ